jgi:hypothetical protein
MLALIVPMEVAMSYALFLNTDRVSSVFSSENLGLVTVVPSQDEDLPRRVLDLKYSIRLSTDGLPAQDAAYTVASALQAAAS